MLKTLSFVELPVRDWPAAVRWYQEVLGLKARHCDEVSHWILFGLPGGGAGLALKEGEPGGDCTVVIEVEDLGSAVRRLRQHGVELLAPVHHSHEGYRMAKLRDPDGNRISLYDWQVGQEI